jgi:hypothetical protein
VHIDECLKLEVQWEATGNPRNPWRAELDGQEWVIQLTHMPGEGDYYGLLIDGTLMLYNMREENWPPNWKKPG